MTTRPCSALTGYALPCGWTRRANCFGITTRPTIPRRTRFGRHGAGGKPHARPMFRISNLESAPQDCNGAARRSNKVAITPPRFHPNAAERHPPMRTGLPSSAWTGPIAPGQRQSFWPMQRPSSPGRSPGRICPSPSARSTGSLAIARCGNSRSHWRRRRPPRARPPTTPLQN